MLRNRRAPLIINTTLRPSLITSQRGILLPHGGSGGGGVDAFQTFINEMASGTVRKLNLNDPGDVATPREKQYFDYNYMMRVQTGDSVTYPPANDAFVDNTACAAAVGDINLLLSNANGCGWHPVKKEFVFGGGGGHGGGGDNSLMSFSPITRLFRLWNLPNPLGLTASIGTDPGAPVTPSVAPDYTVWPRLDGKRGPYPAHNYQGPVYMADTTHMLYYAMHTFRFSSQNIGGIWFIDSDAEDWLQTLQLATTYIYTSGRMVAIPSTNEVWLQSGSSSPRIVEWNGSAYVDAQRGIKFDGGNGSFGCNAFLRDDRTNSGFKEIFSMDNTDLGVTLQVYPKVDDQSNPTEVAKRSYAPAMSGTVPTGLASQHGWAYDKVNDRGWGWPGANVLNKFIAGTGAWEASQTFTAHSGAEDIPDTFFDTPDPCLGKFHFLDEYGVLIGFSDYTEGVNPGVFVFKP